MTKSRRNFQMVLALFLLLCAVSLDYASLSVRADSTDATGSNREAASLKSDSPCLAEDLSRGIRHAVEMIRPSLVTISTVSKSRAISVLPPLLPEFCDGDYSPLNDIPDPLIFRPNTDQPEVATGLIVSEDGYIWTNSDVVRNLESVIVTLQCNTSYEGRVVFDDSESGLAIIKVNADKLPAAHFGSTTKPKIADWAIAVALNDQQEPIVSAGLISNFTRNHGSHLGMCCIHFGFPVSADFRGCAFVNLRGEPIGIDAPTSARTTGASNSCIALDTETVNKLQQKAVNSTASKDQESTHQISTLDDSSATQHFTQKGKEGTLLTLDTFRQFFSVPGSKSTSPTFASSVRSWLTSWQGVNDLHTHPASNASESR